MESALEIIPLEPVIPKDPLSAPVVYCLRGQNNVYGKTIIYLWRPYAKDGTFVGKLIRYDGIRPVLLSEGYIRHFEIRNMIEINPHPGNIFSPCFFRKHMIYVDMKATGPTEGRKLSPKAFQLKKYVYPRFTNMANFTRWEGVKKAGDS